MPPIMPPPRYATSFTTPSFLHSPSASASSAAVGGCSGEAAARARVRPTSELGAAAPSGCGPKSTRKESVCGCHCSSGLASYDSTGSG